MGWTYDPRILVSRDAVRLAIGDTDSTDQQLQDEEIAYLLTLQPVPLAAAITACKRLAARYARQANERTADESFDASVLSQHYRDLATALRDDLLRGATGAVGGSSTGQAGLVYAGGLSINEHIGDSQNSDLMQPIMTKEGFSQPGTEPNSSNTDPAYTDYHFNP